VGRHPDCGERPSRIPPMSEQAQLVPEVIPYLCIKGAAKAIDFYKQAFGAQETFARITDSTGRVGHAEIQIGDSTIMLADEHPEIGVVGRPTLGGSPVSFVVNVPDVDAIVPRAVAAGGAHPACREPFLRPSQRRDDRSLRIPVDPVDPRRGPL
jgi:uncharacterized glyoxalase superfamily protein PhnB